MGTSSSAIKARFIAALPGATFAQLRAAETTTRMAVAQARGGKKFGASLPELEETLAAILAEMAKRG